MAIHKSIRRSTAKDEYAKLVKLSMAARAARNKFDEALNKVVDDKRLYLEMADIVAREYGGSISQDSGDWLA